MNAGRALPVHDASGFVKNRPDPVMLQNAPGGNANFIKTCAIQGLDWKNLDLVETHRVLNTGANRTAAIKIRRRIAGGAESRSVAHNLATRLGLPLL